MRMRDLLFVIVVLVSLQISPTSASVADTTFLETFDDADISDWEIFGLNYVGSAGYWDGGIAVKDVLLRFERLGTLRTYINGGALKTTIVIHQSDLLNEGTWSADVNPGFSNNLRVYFNRFNDTENLFGVSQYSYYLSIFTNDLESGMKWILPSSDINNDKVTFTDPFSGFILVKAYQGIPHVLDYYQPEGGVEAGKTIHITITREQTHNFQVYINGVSRISVTDTATNND